MFALILLEWGALAATIGWAVTHRRALLWAAFIAFAADEVVRWWAWLVVGVLQGVMTREASPGRAW